MVVYCQNQNTYTYTNMLISPNTYMHISTTLQVTIQKDAHLQAINIFLHILQGCISPMVTFWYFCFCQFCIFYLWYINGVKEKKFKVTGQKKYPGQVLWISSHSKTNNQKLIS